MFPYKSLILGGLIAAILIGGGLFVMNKKATINKLDNLNNERQPIAAKKGELVSGFPKELGPNPSTIISSTMFKMSGNQNSYNATYETNVKSSEIVTFYESYLKKNQYTIIRKDLQKDFFSLYANKGEQKLIVTLRPRLITESQSTLVLNVAYVK